MAKILLTIQAKNDEALKSIQTLKAEVQSLSKSLSSIKVNGSGIEATRKGYANLITTLKTLRSQYADGVFGTLPQDAEKALGQIEQISAAFQKNGKLTKTQAKAYAQLSQQLKKYSADLATVKARNDKIVSANPFTVTQAQQIPRLIKQYSTLLKTIQSTEKYYPKGTFDTFTVQLTEGQTQLAALNQEFLRTQTLTPESQQQLINLANGFNQLNASVAQTTSTMKSSKGGLLDIVAGFAKFQLSAMLVMKPLQLIRNGLSSINETLVKTEDAVIALQRVLPSGSATDEEISSKVYGIAQKYGQTFENVSEIATNFARTGMSWADTIKATEAAVLALNVAELDAEEATNGLVAILSQFELGASDLEGVIDKLNKTADNFPVTTEKILAALQRTGSAAKNANLNLDQTIAVITALSKATGRSGENIGTALNSLIQYSSKSSALDTFAALSKESAAVVNQFRQGSANILDVWRQVSAEIQNLKSDQADLLDSYFQTEDGTALQDALDGELQDIYTELGGVYDTANTFRKNYFIALLGNMDTVEQAMDTLGDAAGYSQSENEKYLKTYTAKLNSLKAQWQKLANDEQGILGLKKSLVDIGSGLLTVMNYTGKLTTLFLLAGAAISKVIGAKFAESLATHIMSMSHLSRVIRGQAVPATIDYKEEIRRLKAEILGATDSETLLARQTELLSMRQQRLTGILKNASTALTAAFMVFSVISAVQGAIDQAEADRIEREEEELRKLHEKVSASLEAVDANKALAQTTLDYAESIKELRDTLESAASTEEEKKSAQAQLLSIQSSLIESNETYASSLDLVNGKLDEQLGLVEKMSEEQLRQQAKKFMDESFGQKGDVDKLVGQGATTVELLNGTAFDNGKNKDLIRNLILNARENGLEFGLDNYVNAPNWNPLINMEEAIRDGFNGKGWDIWKLLGFNVHKEDWTGESSNGIELTGTLEERIKQLQEFRQLIVDNYTDWGLSKSDAEAYVKRLDAALADLNSEENQNAIAWAKKAQAAEDFYNGIIDEETFVERFYGITKKTAEVTEDWHNNIAKVTEEYETLIDALEKLRDKDKEILDLEEKKQAVLEAQRALEAARNEATVRRFNQETGQWEWQTDEKKIAEAEENLDKARDDLEEQAYDTIIDQLKNKTATNDGLNALLEGLIDFLGTGFVDDIKDAVLDNTNVDLNKPINETSGAGGGGEGSASDTGGAGAEGNGIQVLKNADGSYATGKGINKDKVGDNGSVEWDGEKYRIENAGASTDEELARLVEELGLPDRTIFAYKGNIYGVLDGGIVRLRARRSSYGDKNKHGYNALSNAVTEEFGSYDNGGIASGMGYMPKATNRPESVNNPDLTAQILSPVSNAEFHRYVRDMGLLFETSRQYAQSPVVERVGGNTDNSVNNSGQVIIKDVNVGAEQRDNLLGILALGGIVPNV